MNGFLQGLAIFSACKPKWSITKEQATVWAVVVGTDIPDDVLVTAALQLSRESEFDPTPAGWRARALEILNGPCRTSAEAWDELCCNRRALQMGMIRDGVSGSTPAGPMWSSEVVRRAAEAVHWRSPNWKTDQLPTIRAHFKHFYDGLADKREEIDAVQDAQRALPEMVKALERRWKPQVGDGRRPSPPSGPEVTHD